MTNTSWLRGTISEKFLFNMLERLVTLHSAKQNNSQRTGPTFVIRNSNKKKRFTLDNHLQNANYPFPDNEWKF